MLKKSKHLINSVIKHDGVRRYASNTSWMLSEKLLRLISGVLVGIWVARYLGPQQFGVFSYVLAFVALFSSIAKLGLDSIVVRDLINEPLKKDIYLGTAFWLKLCGAFISLGMVGIALLFTSNTATTNIYIWIVASGIVFQAFEVIDFYFQSKVLLKFVSICRLMQLIVSSLARIYLVVSGAELFWFVVVTCIDQITLAVSLYFVYRYQNNRDFLSRFNVNVARKMLAHSWPLIFSGFVVTLYMRIDQIMIKEILGEKEVGLYSAAVRLSEVWYFVPILITQSLFPAIVGAKKINEELYILRLQRLYTFMLWISLMIALPTALASNWIINFLYGAEFSEAGKILMIHTWAGVFVSLGVVSSSWLVSENMQKIALYRTLAGAITNVVLNFYFIPLWGIVGAAYATVISYMVAGFLFDLLSQKTRIMFVMKINALFLRGI